MRVVKPPSLAEVSDFQIIVFIGVPGYARLAKPQINVNNHLLDKESLAQMFNVVKLMPS